MEVLCVENVQTEYTQPPRLHIYTYAYLDLDIKITPKLSATILNICAPQPKPVYFRENSCDNSSSSASDYKPLNYAIGVG